MGKDAETGADTRCAFRTEALPWMENVRRFARSLCHDPTDTEDLVQVGDLSEAREPDST